MSRDLLGGARNRAGFVGALKRQDRRILNLERAHFTLSPIAVQKALKAKAPTKKAIARTPSATSPNLPPLTGLSGNMTFVEE